MTSSEAPGPTARALQELAPKLRGFFVNRGCTPSVAEDLCQETLLKVWRKRDLFDAERGALATWVFTIARNVFVDHVRRISRAQPDPTDPAWVPSTPDGAEHCLEQREQVERIRSALASLPEAQRQALRATLLEGRSMAQWADESETAPGTVKTRVRLGLQKLRKVLTDER